MNILYILGAYKPNPSANGICSDNIIAQLLREGNRVTVLANAVPGCPAHQKPSDQLEIYRVRQRLYLRMQMWRQIHQAKKPRLCRAVGHLAWIINKCQLLLTAPLWPKISPATVRRFSQAAVALEKERHFDMVIAVYNPVEALLAGYEVKRHSPGVRFIPYFLDALSGGYGPKTFSPERIRRQGMAVEAPVFAAADQVVLMQASKAHYTRYYPTDKLRFLDLPMLVPLPENEPKAFSGNRPVRLLYTGTITNGVRDPGVLVDTLLQLPPQHIVCEVVGNIQCPEKFAPLAQHLGDNFVLSSAIAPAQLQKKLAAADVLVNIGNLLPTMVPSKLFSYIAYGKPIISTYDIPEDSSLPYLARYPAALLLSRQSSAQENGEKLSAFLRQLPQQAIAFDDLSAQFYANTPEAFTACVSGLAARSDAI